MTKEEIRELVNSAETADLGFIDSMGMPQIRRVFCTCHKGVGRHLISTNTSSMHVQEILKNGNACLYFADSSKFQCVCLNGQAVFHQEPFYREMLWHEGDEMYYPKGVTDEDYCVIEFIAQKGRTYADLGADNITQEMLEDWDSGADWIGPA